MFSYAERLHQFRDALAVAKRKTGVQKRWGVLDAGEKSLNLNSLNRAGFAGG